MKTLNRKMMMGLAGLVIATTVGAAEAPKNDAAALRDSQQNLVWEARNAKGVDRQQLREEAQRLQLLIDDVERGRKVDPAEIDRALGRSR